MGSPKVLAGSRRENGDMEGESLLMFADAAAYDGSIFLQDLPENVLAQLSDSLLPRDLCNLSLTCKKLHALCSSDKFWWPQCKNALTDRTMELQSWRTVMPSYKSIYRFIRAVKPLLGIWVHQNPESGNMVYVTWGFLSVVGCRIIPQELGPRGLETGLLWAPVFEVIGSSDGSMYFFLHGRERDKDFCYPGCFDAPAVDCNVLFLEAEPRSQMGSPVTAMNSATFVEFEKGVSSSEDLTSLLKAGTKGSKIKKAVNTGPISFQQLQFVDRRRMLDSVARHVRLKLPSLANEPLFPCFKSGYNRESDASVAKKELQREMLLLSERRSLLLWMYSHGDPDGGGYSSDMHFVGMNSAYLLEQMCSPTDKRETIAASPTEEGEPSKGKVRETARAPPKPSDYEPVQSQSSRTSSFAKLIRGKMKQIIGMGQDQELGRLKDGAGNTMMKRLLLLRFLKQGDSIALRLHAKCCKLDTYFTWPRMSENRFALYKMEEQMPEKGREHAGLWAGTFGWPPGKPAEDKPGKALYFLLLSYVDSEEGLLLIATKILEGTHYVLHPNGSPMFTVKVNDASSESFPWPADRDGTPVDIVQAFQGRGIANGYGFQYPLSKPGDLFVDRKGMLAFVYRDSQVVLTLQRLDLQALLERGERVAALSPVANFAYLTKAFSDVFAGYGSYWCKA